MKKRLLAAALAVCSFSAAAWGATAPLSLGSTRGAGIDYAPAVPRPSRTGDIVGLDLQNAAATAEPAGYVTFGQVFKDGDVLPTDSLVARIAGSDTPAQMDVKATNADGSVRHAVITFDAPAIPPGASVQVMLAKGTATLPTAHAPTAAVLAASGYNVSTTIAVTAAPTISSPSQDLGSFSAQASKALQKAQSWLSGPLVNEYIATTTVDNGLLKVEFDITAYADRSTKTDVIYDNSWFFASGKSDLTYGVTISQGGAQVYSRGGIRQYLYSLWRHEVASTGAVTPNVQFDVAYMERTGAILDYDISPGVADSQVRSYHGANNSGDGSGTPFNSTAPMGVAGVDVSMPDVGGRVEGDWGPEPNWVNLWLASQNATAYTVMMENADAAGGVPWHYTDEATNLPVNPDTYPDLNIGGSTPSPANGWPHICPGPCHSTAPYISADGDPWAPDPAHMPDFNYVPYLVTGSHYQLMLLDAQADFSIAEAFGRTRDDTSGAVPMGIASPVSNETRAMAYELRQVAEAVFIDPDADGMKATFQNELRKAMTAYKQEYITDRINGTSGALNGFIAGYAGPNPGMIVSFEEDVMADAFALVAGMNLPTVSPLAVQMLRFMDGYEAGRFTNGANGFNPYLASSYWESLTDGVSGTRFKTWAAFSMGNEFVNWVPTLPAPAGITATTTPGGSAITDGSGVSWTLSASDVSGADHCAVRNGTGTCNGTTGGSDRWGSGYGTKLAVAGGRLYLENTAGTWYFWSPADDPHTFFWEDNVNGAGANSGYEFHGLGALAGLVTYVTSGADEQAYNWLSNAIAGDFGGASGVLAQWRSYPQLHIVPPASVEAPSASIEASSTVVAAGQSTTLTWTSGNATSCAGTNFSTANATSNAVGVSVSPARTTTYTVSCTGPKGTVTDAVNVVVGATTVSPDGTILLPGTNASLTDAAGNIWTFFPRSGCSGWNSGCQGSKSRFGWVYDNGAWANGGLGNPSVLEVADGGHLYAYTGAWSMYTGKPGSPAWVSASP